MVKRTRIYFQMTLSLSTKSFFLKLLIVNNDENQRRCLKPKRTRTYFSGQLLRYSLLSTSHTCPPHQQGCLAHPTRTNNRNQGNPRRSDRWHIRSSVETRKECLSCLIQSFSPLLKQIMWIVKCPPVECLKALTISFSELVYRISQSANAANQGCGTLFLPHYLCSSRMNISVMSFLSSATLTCHIYRLADPPLKNCIDWSNQKTFRFSKTIDLEMSFTIKNCTWFL